MPIHAFEDALDPSNYQSVPKDSWIALSDIRGSTAAIQSGRYKDVNAVGAATIIAILNACGRESLPFVFGGDGSAVVIPERHLEATKQALLGCKKMARLGFQFELRCGLVPLSELVSAGVSLETTSFELTPGVGIPLFRGGALALADQWVKDPARRSRYEVTVDELENAPDANFSGLECRWKPIPSEKGQIMTVILQFSAHTPPDRARALIQALGRAAGWRKGKPTIKRSQLQLAVRPSQLNAESQVLTAGLPRLLTRMRATLFAGLSLLAGRLLYAFPVIRPWKTYFEGVRIQVDDRKYDDVVRAVIDLSEKDWLALEQLLTQAQSEGWLQYGAHRSKEMLMTCMVFDREQGHLHFIDGADGGYDLAAKQLKAALATSET